MINHKKIKKIKKIKNNKKIKRLQEVAFLQKKLKNAYSRWHSINRVQFRPKILFFMENSNIT